MDEPVFLDTVGLIAVLNKDDKYHHSAAETFDRLGSAGRKVVTTELILGEFGNGLARTGLRHEVGWLIRQLYADPSASVIHVDRILFEAGLELYLSREDKSWGLVDCVSFAAMLVIFSHKLEPLVRPASNAYHSQQKEAIAGNDAMVHHADHSKRPTGNSRLGDDAWAFANPAQA